MTAEQPVPTGPEADDALFARNMVTFRERAGISQADLVERLNELGWASAYQTTISRIEKGTRPARIGEARMIARALQVDLAQLTLSAAESLSVSRLSYAREKLRETLQAIRLDTHRWAKARDALRDLVDSMKADGITPTQLPHGSDHDPWPSFHPVTAGDELALAIQAIGRDPKEEVDAGIAFHHLELRQREYDGRKA